jgi:hypothetical protein
VIVFELIMRTVKVRSRENGYRSLLLIQLSLCLEVGAGKQLRADCNHYYYRIGILAREWNRLDLGAVLQVMQTSVLPVTFLLLRVEGNVHMRVAGCVRAAGDCTHANVLH